MVYGEEETQNSTTVTDDNVGRRILDTAAAIISREGYENLTIRKVAKESGCSNSAIYQRFGDKNALADAVAVLQAKPLLVIMDEAYANDEDLFTNLNRVTGKLLEKMYSFGMEALHMQMVYHGKMEIIANPFILWMERYLKDAVARGEARIADTKATAFILISSFLGFVQMVSANESIDQEAAYRLLELHNRSFYYGIANQVNGGNESDPLWVLLRERGVDVDKALARMKGNKTAYKNFLKEFFEDPDFGALGTAIEAGNVKNAFEYAHGLKGMAANLGLDEVRSRLSVLVEILRPGGLEGAREAYDDVMEACGTITVLL